MQSKPGTSRCAGFTLIELLVVLAILGIAMGLGIPALHNFIVRSRTEGFAREASTLLQRSRLAAIQSNREVAVGLEGDVLVAWVDADGSGDVNPDPAEPYKTTDWVVGRTRSPSDKVFWMDQDKKKGQASIDGFTDFGGLQRAVFQPNGSITDEGAFRIADQRGNVLEIRVAPAATARIELRKWQPGDEASEPEEPEEGEDPPDHWLATGDPSDPDYTPWKWS